MKFQNTFTTWVFVKNAIAWLFQKQENHFLQKKYFINAVTVKRKTVNFYGAVIIKVKGVI